VDESESNNPVEFSRQSLERIRKRLLDLTARNRLLNFRHTAAQTVRIIDELPDPVYQRLIDGKSFQLSPVPDPTEQQLIEDGYIVYDEETGEKTKDSFPRPEQWATRLGLNTDYELPPVDSDSSNEAHHDNQLQTLLFNEALESRLQKIRRLSNTAMDESGANILFLSLGFLEWREHRESDKKRIAPLFVVPVNIARSKRTGTGSVRKYTVTLRDDDLLSNISLSERLLVDFGIELPPLQEDTTPEAYFDDVLRIVTSVDSGWQIKRYATLCLLDFTKQVMYQDLNPDNWPVGHSIVDHPLVSKFFTDAVDDSDEPLNAYLEEHEIDALENVHKKYPLIYEADSSQHSAVVDVVEGKNLVIEGPPGTGKSQTITNLIAACINQGKRVLFVAEKLAALEVVKRRLDQAGLGDYCLELHSHKSNKVELLQSLVSSVAARETNRAPAELQSEINRYEAHKETLHDYADKLNTVWKGTGLTPHQILQRAVDFRERSPVDPTQAEILIGDPESINSELVAKHLDTAERLRLVFDAVAEQADEGRIENHHWYGVDKNEVIGADRDRLIKALSDWTESLEHIADRWQAMSKGLGVSDTGTPSMDSLAYTLSQLALMPDEVPTACLERAAELHEHRDDLVLLSSQRTRFKPEYLFDEDASNEVTFAITTLRETLGLKASASAERIASHPDSIDVLIERVKNLSDKLEPLRSVLPEPFEVMFTESSDGIESLSEFLNLADELPIELWNHRDPILQQPSAKRCIDIIGGQINELRERRDELEDFVDIHDAPSAERLKQLRRTVNTAGFFGFLKADVRAAKRELKSLAVAKLDYKSLDEHLSELARYQESVAKLESNYARNPVLGHLYQGLETPVDQMDVIASWCEKVQSVYGFGGGESAARGDALLNLTEPQVRVLMRSLQSGLGEDTAQLRSGAEKLMAIYPLHFDGLEASENWVNAPQGLLSLQKSVAECLECVRLRLVDHSLPLSDLGDVVSRWRACVLEHTDWVSDDLYAQFVPSLFQKSIPVTHKWQDLQALSRNWNRICR